MYDSGWRPWGPLGAPEGATRWAHARRVSNARGARCTAGRFQQCPSQSCLTLPPAASTPWVPGGPPHRPAQAAHAPCRAPAPAPSERGPRCAARAHCNAALATRTPAANRAPQRRAVLHHTDAHPRTDTRDPPSPRRPSGPTDRTAPRSQTRPPCSLRPRPRSWRARSPQGMSRTGAVTNHGPAAKPSHPAPTTCRHPLRCAAVRFGVAAAVAAAALPEACQLQHRRRQALVTRIARKNPTHPPTQALAACATRAASPTLPPSMNAVHWRRPHRHLGVILTSN
mmetsp:Transcript_29664/g.97004  ORF Transcript_29664/g.97004 Transcript_29664/m.97004 type:complete len:283 (-) Transcript_29664:1254-2102(-)